MLHSSLATIKDKFFIIGCILSGSKKGRFMLDVYIPISMKNIKPEIHSILSSHCTLSGDPAYALIYKRNGKRVGFAIIKSSIAWDMSPTLHAMAVSPGYRGKGYGSIIVDDAFGWHLPNYYYHMRAGPTVVTRKLFDRYISNDDHIEIVELDTTNNLLKAA